MKKALTFSQKLENFASLCNLPLIRLSDSLPICPRKSKHLATDGFVTFSQVVVLSAFITQV